MVSTNSRYGGGYRTGGFRNRVAVARGGGVQELKFIDTEIATGFTSNWVNCSGVSLHMVTQGSGASQRIGRCIYIKYIYFKGYFICDDSEEPTADDAGNMFRFAIVEDKQCNGALPGVTDIWEASGAAPTQFRNLEKSSRFRVHYDRTYNANRYIAGEGTNIHMGGKVIPVKFRKRVNIKIEFDASTGNIGDIANTALYIFACGTGESSVGGVLRGNARIRYSG